MAGESVRPVPPTRVGPAVAPPTTRSPVACAGISGADQAGGSAATGAWSGMSATTSTIEVWSPIPNWRSPGPMRPPAGPFAGSCPSAVPVRPEKPDESVSTAAPNTELAASSVPAATAVRRTREGVALLARLRLVLPARLHRPVQRVRGAALPPEQGADRDGEPVLVHIGHDGAESVAVQQLGHGDHRLRVRAPTTCPIFGHSDSPPLE